jgi:hypothetical protein
MFLVMLSSVRSRVPSVTTIKHRQYEYNCPDTRPNDTPIRPFWDIHDGRTYPARTAGTIVISRSATRSEHDACNFSIKATVGESHESPEFGNRRDPKEEDSNKKMSGSCLRDPVVTPQVKQMEVGHRFVRTCPHRGSRETCG